MVPGPVDSEVPPIHLLKGPGSGPEVEAEAEGGGGVEAGHVMRGGGRDPPASLTFDIDTGMTAEECQVGGWVGGCVPST